jgi:hypothetical protein
MATSSFLAQSGSRRIPTSLNQAGRLALMYGQDRWVKPPAVFGLRIRGAIETTVLQQALTAIARRHSALRTFFPPEDSPDWAACLEPLDVHWNVNLTDLTGLAEPERTQVERTTLLALQACFSPTTPPLFRSTLIKYGRDDWLLGIAVDHILFDGASIPVFLRELEMLYESISQGHSVAALSVPTSDFAQFAAAERAWLHTPEAERARAYWRPVWEGCGPFPQSGFPTVARAPGKGTGRIWRTTLPAAAVTATQRAFPGGHLSLFALAAGAVLSVQGRLTGRTDNALIHSSARRSTEQTAKTIGCLTSRVLLRVPVALYASLYEIASLARGRILDSMEHEMMPFEHLLDTLSPGQAGRKPQAPYVFLSVDSPLVPPRLGAAAVEITSPVIGDAFCDMPWLSVDLDRTSAEDMTLSCGYQATLFSDDFIDELMGGVAALLMSPLARTGHRRASEAHTKRRIQARPSGACDRSMVHGPGARPVHAGSHR